MTFAPPPPEVSYPAAPRRAAAGLAALACLAAVALYSPFLVGPVLWEDDFRILAQSYTWQRTRASLWVPNNEHVMPLGRLLTYGLVRLSGGPAGLPRAAGLVGPTALVAAMLLLGAFVRRELGHARYGLVAMTLFGVTSVYLQAVWWFAATFVVLALDTTLLALLAAQSWRRTGRWAYLALAAAASAVAPGWFASGILAGPLVAVYLLPWLPARQEPAGVRGPAAWLGPPAVLAGSAAFLAVSLPRTADAILHTSHYQGKTALEAFNLTAGAISSARSVVDNLLLGVFGVGGVPWSVPLPVVPVILAGLAALLGWWWLPALRSGARGVRLLPVGLALVAANYLLVYSTRADWGYEGLMTLMHWSRYHILPQLGLALLVVGAWPARQGPPTSPRRQQGEDHPLLAPRACIPPSMPPTGETSPTRQRGEAAPLLAPRACEDGGAVALSTNSEGLSRREAWYIALLIGACFLVQWPRALLTYYPYFPLPRQQTLLRHIAELDARCREYHIGADAARAALHTNRVSLAATAWALGAEACCQPGPAQAALAAFAAARGDLDFRDWYGDGDAGDFLYGSDDPRPRPAEEVRRILGIEN
jgi:hypothetical protein